MTESVLPVHSTRRPIRAPGARGFRRLALLVVVAGCGSSDQSTDGAGGVADRAEVMTDVEVAARSELNDALIDAAWSNDVMLARDLIASGADVNAQDRTQQSAYLIATSEGYGELLRLTLVNGADVASKDSYNGTGLIRAAERGHADIVGQLLLTNIDVDHINNLGWTALHEAIILGSGDQRYVDTVRLLVAGGADPTIPTGDGIVPVQLARDRDQHEVAGTLAAASGAPPPNHPNVALLTAAADGDGDAAAIALAAGADLDTRDARNRTPLDRAIANGHDDIARLLIRLGAAPPP